MKVLLQDPDQWRRNLWWIAVLNVIRPERSTRFGGISTKTDALIVSEKKVFTISYASSLPMLCLRLADGGNSEYGWQRFML